ncbi:MAG: hypothetical protein QXL54_04350 [Candidatus Bathyarchaeia archaeon]
MSVLLRQSALLNFDELLAKIVNHVLRSVFSERFVFSVWTYLELAASMEPIDIARSPEVFSNCLRKLFGSAAEDLEKLILKCLCQVLGLKLELKESVKFSDYISELRKIYTKIEFERYKKLTEG